MENVSNYAIITEKIIPKSIDNTEKLEKTTTNTNEIKNVQKQIHLKLLGENSCLENVVLDEINNNVIEIDGEEKENLSYECKKFKKRSLQVGNLSQKWRRRAARVGQLKG